MMLITLCFRSSYLSCPLPPHALEQGWGTSSGSPTLELAPKPHDAPGCSGPLCSGASTILPPEQGGTRGLQELWVLAAPPLPAEGARHHQDGEIEQGSLKASVRRREALPGYVPRYYNAPFGFGCSYLVALPGTEREETGELTACDQGAIPAAAGYGESSYPTGKSKGNSNAQRRLLFTQHHLPPSLVFCTVPDPFLVFHLAANTSHHRAADPELLRELKFFSFIRKMLCTQTSTGRTSSFN